MKKIIWANTIVHNEENFIWFSLMSVIDYLDKIVIYDTGSTDQTVEIIEKIIKIKKNKIIFREVGKVDGEKFTKMRQAMLNESKSDWILVLDGDEIWWEDSIKKVISEINKKDNEAEGIVVPMIVPVGDIFHIQDNSAGRYEITGRKGHLSLKAIRRKIPGLHVRNPYRQEGYFNSNNIPIQKMKNITFMDVSILHVTHLRRSSIQDNTRSFKYEIGERVQPNYKFPEVFNKKYPVIVPSPWTKISGIAAFQASILTPIRKIKRKTLN